MLIRIYADDAKRIAETCGVKESLERETATWAEPELRYPLTQDRGVVLVKVRMGGTTQRKLHHYYLLASEREAHVAFELVQSNCNKSRCYYVMPEMYAAAQTC